MTRESAKLHRHPNSADLPLEEDEIAEDMFGKNSLQGDDQASVRNQRRVVPDVDRRPTSVIETFRRQDPRLRAKKDKRR